MTEHKVAKRQYTEEYKIESARLAHSVGINEASRRRGEPSATLGNGARRLAASRLVSDDVTQRAMPARSVSELEAENARLRKELASARLDAEILGKATAYFAKGLR